LKFKNTVFIVNDLIKIGKLSKLHGIKGSVVLQMLAPYQLEVKKIRNFFIEINQTPTPFFVTEIKLSGKNLILNFDSIKTLEAAQKIIGYDVLVAEENIIKQKAVKDLTGYKLIDKNRGDLGLILEVVDIPGQRMFSLSVGGKEVLLPFVEDFVVKIEHKTKTVQYHAPDGLIDIYIG